MSKFFILVVESHNLEGIKNDENVLSIKNIKSLHNLI